MCFSEFLHRIMPYEREWCDKPKHLKISTYCMIGQSLVVLLVAVDAVLNAISSLSRHLQTLTISASNIEYFVQSTKNHLSDIVNNDNASWRDQARILYDKASEVVHIEDDDTSEVAPTIKRLHKKFVDTLDQKFNNSASIFMRSAAVLSTYRTCAAADDFQTSVENIGRLFPHVFENLDRLRSEALSFHYFAQEKSKELPDGKPIHDLLTRDLGYPLLRALSCCIECTPSTTASVERSFSAMNGIHTKLRNKLSPVSLNHLMMVAIEGPNELSDETVTEIMRSWSSQKCRRIKLF